MKYLIAGLGNPGPKYENTRHNVGFKILDALAKASNISFMDKRYGYISELKYKGRTLILLKPTTFVNLSGGAINYWLAQSKLNIEHLLVVVDDLALPFGTLRLKPKGGDAGHNGLNNIQTVLGTTNYARLRFGIGSDFAFGSQVNYVLGDWSSEENDKLDDLIITAGEAIKSFATIGMQYTMNKFNS